MRSVRWTTGGNASGNTLREQAKQMRGRNELHGAIIGAGMSLLGGPAKENWFGGTTSRRLPALHTRFVVPDEFG